MGKSETFKGQMGGGEDRRVTSNGTGEMDKHHADLCDLDERCGAVEEDVHVSTKQQAPDVPGEERGGDDQCPGGGADVGVECVDAREGRQPDEDHQVDDDGETDGVEDGAIPADVDVADVHPRDVVEADVADEEVPRLEICDERERDEEEMERRGGVLLDVHEQRDIEQWREGRQPEEEPKPVRQDDTAEKDKPKPNGRDGVQRGGEDVLPEGRAGVEPLADVQAGAVREEDLQTARGDVKAALHGVVGWAPEQRAGANLVHVAVQRVVQIQVGERDRDVVARKDECLKVGVVTVGEHRRGAGDEARRCRKTKHRRGSVDGSVATNDKSVLKDEIVEEVVRQCWALDLSEPIVMVCCSICKYSLTIQKENHRATNRSG